MSSKVVEANAKIHSLAMAVAVSLVPKSRPVDCQCHVSFVVLWRSFTC